MSEPADDRKPGDEVKPSSPSSGPDACPTCNGSGEVGGKTCPDCEGTGTVQESVGGG